LFRQSAQRGLRRLLDISFFCRCCTQRHSKARESTREPGARLGRTPTHTRIEAAIAVCILNGERSLSHTAHALHRRATYRRLRHGSGLVPHQDGVEPIKFVGAAREACDTRRHRDERTRRRWRCLRLALGCGDDATLALLSIRYAYEVLIDAVG
jgi:hypothetical protein